MSEIWGERKLVVTSQQIMESQPPRPLKVILRAKLFTLIDILDNGGMAVYEGGMATTSSRISLQNDRP